MSDPRESRLHPARTRATFLAWTTSALPRALALTASASAPTLLPTAALAVAWTLAGRDIAARLALACARERLVAADRGPGAVVLRPTGGAALSVPIARAGAFGLDRPDLDAARDPALDRPLALLDRLALDLSLGPGDHARIADELADSAFNYAVALVVAELRARTLLAGRRWPAPLDPESLVIAGHPWHPMCKTRLGLHLHDNLRHGPDVMARGTTCAVDVLADDVVRVGEFAEHAVFPAPAPGWVRLPVHLLQRRRLPQVFAAVWGARMRPAACFPRAGRSLLSLRTVALGELHIKLATAMHTTSALRQVSPMSVHNGPAISALLARVLAADPSVSASLRVQPELAAAGLDPRRHGGLAGQLGVIIRPEPAPLARELSAAASPEVWVCAALGERRPGADVAASLMHDPGLLHRRAGDRLLRTITAAYPSPDHALRDYISKLVPPVLRLCAAHGVALEVHLQNTLVVHDRGRVAGFLVRDLGGVRIHRPRLRAAGHDVALAPGSFVVTDDLAEVQSKVAHTLLHAHLTAVIGWAAELGADEPALWRYTRQVIRDSLGAWAVDPRHAAACHADRDALLAPSARAKALLKMRLGERVSDYAYTEVAAPFA
jgi:hypothetical protein